MGAYKTEVNYLPAALSADGTSVSYHKDLPDWARDLVIHDPVKLVDAKVSPVTVALYLSEKVLDFVKAPGDPIPGATWYKLDTVKPAPVPVLIPEEAPQKDIDAFVLAVSNLSVATRESILTHLSTVSSPTDSVRVAVDDLEYIAYRLRGL